jgi:glutathione S-transferase
MLTIWGRANSINVQKALWAAEECGLKFERIDAGGAFGKTDQPEYLAMNPNRVVPTIVDGDVTIWESNTCIRYLAATYSSGNLWPTDPKVRAMGERWMDWQLSTISEPMRVTFWGLVRTPPEKRDMAAIAAAAKQAGELWKRVDEWLAGKRYLGGDRFTVGDIPLGCFCYRWYALPIERPELANVKAWYERLRERAPYMKHVALPMT